MQGRRPLNFARAIAIALVWLDLGVVAAPAQQTPFFDLYILSLSWEPSFCETHQSASDECQPGSGDGFVLHGLWPQGEQGYAENCASAFVPRRVVDAARDLYPSVRLMLHEWYAHGTCSGESAAAYFADVRRARARVVVPSVFTTDRPFQADADDLVRRFVAANPGAVPDSVAISCHGDELAEARICLTKDLSGFRACPSSVRTDCSAKSIRIPAPQ